MTGLFLLWSGFVSLYIALAVLGARAIDAEEKQQEVEFIESVGGEDSPWMNPEVTTSPWVSPEYFTSRYSTWDRQLYEGIPEMLVVRPQPQAPAPVPAAVPEPVPMSQGLNHVTPMVSADATPKNNTDVGGGVGVADVGGVEGWLERNAVHFPLEVPPENITSDAGLNALNEAREWIKNALTAGVSKRKIITEIFGASYGTNKASKRINQIIREVQC